MTSNSIITNKVERENDLNDIKEVTRIINSHKNRENSDSLNHSDNFNHGKVYKGNELNDLKGLITTGNTSEKKFNPGTRYTRKEMEALLSSYNNKKGKGTRRRSVIGKSRKKRRRKSRVRGRRKSGRVGGKKSNLKKGTIKRTKKI